MSAVAASSAESPKKYGIGSTRTPTGTAGARTMEKKDVKTPGRAGATPTSAAARSPTKPATPRTPTTPRTGTAASANAKTPQVSSAKKPDYSNVTSKIGSKAKLAHKPGGGNVKIESHKVKIEAKSRVGSLDNASHKPAGGDKKVENGADGGSPV